VLTVQGQVLSERGEFEQAQHKYEAALALLRQALGDDHLALADPLDSLAIALRRRGKLEQAEETSRLALDLRIRWLGERHPDTAHQRINLGAVLDKRKQYEEAQQQYRMALEILVDAKASRRDVAPVRANLGSLLARLDRLDEAEEELRKAVDDWEAELGPSHPWVAKARISLGRVLHDQARYVEAALQLERALAILEPQEPTPEIETTKQAARKSLAKSLAARTATPAQETGSPPG
jgi:tetratricopeptide (TPR) repeat protein